VLPNTAYAILGLLTFGRELSGYDVKKWADASLKFFWWSPATSHVYRELTRLEELGLVASRPAPDAERRKRLYRITARGREVAAEWVTAPVAEPVVVKHPVALRLWLGHLGDPEQLRTVLEEHLVEARRLLSEIDTSIARSADDETMEYPRVVLEWMRTIYAADEQATGTALRKLPSE
jgi:DNA-binding PadR family transcriptional regulator